MAWLPERNACTPRTIGQPCSCCARCNVATCATGIIHCNLKYRCAAQQRTMVNVPHATCDNSTQHATIVLWHAVACLDLCHLNGKAALDSAVVLEHCTRRGPASHSSRARTHIDCSFARTFYTQMAVHSRQATRHLPLCVCACECAQCALPVSDFSCQPHFRRRLLSKAWLGLAWLGLAWLGLAWQFRPRWLQLQFQFQGRAHRR